MSSYNAKKNIVKSVCWIQIRRDTRICQKSSQVLKTVLLLSEYSSFNLFQITCSKNFFF